MTKQEYLTQLRRELKGLPERDIRESMEYYSEMIDDRMESGLSERAAVSMLDSPKKVGKEIKLDSAQSKPIPKKGKNPWKAWEIALLILGSPLWLPLGLTALVLLFVLFALLWVGIAVLWVVDLAVGVAGLASLLTAFPLLFSSIPNALFNFGLAFLCAGVAILGFFGCLRLSKLSVLSLKKIKSVVIRRNKKDEQNN